jgi:hypothetical protein
MLVGKWPGNATVVDEDTFFGTIGPEATSWRLIRTLLISFCMVGIGCYQSHVTTVLILVSVVLYGSCDVSSRIETRGSTVPLYPKCQSQFDQPEYVSSAGIHRNYN